MTATSVDCGVQYVENVAAIRQLCLSTCCSDVETGGYYSRFSGGGGRYRPDPSDISSQDNGGTVLIGSDGVRWKLLDAPTLSHFGARGNGSVDDTDRIQAAVSAVVNPGGVLRVTPGAYLMGAVTADVRNGGAIIGDDRSSCTFKPRGNGVVMFDFINSTIGITALKPFSVKGVGFDGTGSVGVTCLQTTDFALHTFKDLWFKNVAYKINAVATTNGPLGFSCGLTIDGIEQFGYGSIRISSQGVGETGNRIFGVNISNIQQYSAGLPGWSDHWITLRRVVNCNLNNCINTAMEGQAQGIYCVGASEGIFLNNVIVVYGTTGITLNKENDSVHPKWVYMNNVGVDQMSVTGIDIDAEYVRINGANVTGGALRHNCGYGVHIRPTTSDFTFTGLQVANNNYSGLLIQNGAKRGYVSGCDLEQNGKISGYDLDGVLQYAGAVEFAGNTIGTCNLNGTGVINDGSSSSFVSSSRNQIGTDANTLPKTLAGYTLPAGSFSGTQKLTIVSSGIFAADSNQKSVIMNFGGLPLYVLVGIYNNIAWKIEANIYRNGVQAWADIHAYYGASCNVSSVNLTSVNLAGPISMSLVAQNGSPVANDILMNHFDVSLVN